MAESLKINKIRLSFDKIVYLDAEHGNDITGNGSTKEPYKTLKKGIQDYSGFTAFKMADGVYDSVNINSRTYDDGIAFIGNGKNTIFSIVTTLTIVNSQPALYGDLYFYNLVWEGNNYSGGHNFISLLYNRTYFYNVVFKNTADNKYAYFDVESSGKLYMYNCTKSTTSASFLRGTAGGLVQLTNCYGAFISGYGTSQSGWDYKTNIITQSPNLDGDYNILSTGWKGQGTGLNANGTQADIGVYGGEFAWGWQNSVNLVKFDNSYYSFIDNEWQQVGTTEDDLKELFTNYGMDDISDIDKDNLSWFTEPVKIVTYIEK